MATKNSNLSFTLKLLGWKNLVEGADKSAGAMGKLGHSAKKAGDEAGNSRGWGIFERNVTKSTKKAETSANRARHSLHGMIGGLAAFGVGYEAVTGLRESLDVTERLGEAALNLNRVQGIGVAQAGQLAMVAQVRGIGVQKFAQGLNILSRNIVAAGTGSKTALTAFSALGLTQQEVVRGGRDLYAFFGDLSKRFTAMPGGALKAATALKLFGRGAQTLTPLFREGRESLAQDMKWAREFGVSMPKNASSLQDYIYMQRRAKFATLGLQETIGIKLMPIVASMTAAWPRLVNNIRHGNGAWATVRTILHGVSLGLAGVTGWFSKSKKATQGLVWGLTALGAAMAIEKVVEFVTWLRKLWVVERLVAGAQLALNAAMLLNPYVAAAAGIAAVAAGFYLAYKRVRWFHNAVNGTALFIKNHWPLAVGLLAGPLGIAVAEVAKNFGRIKSAAHDAVHGVANAFRSLIAFLGRAAGAINNKLGGVPGFALKLIGHLPGLAAGGVVTAPGSVMVGERGPELLRLPRGASVHPLNGASGGLGDIATVVRALADRPLQLVVDGRVLAEVNAKHQLRGGRRLAP